ncbi:hypothetical protein AVO45_11675 [Ruegeria marisrubri]|uniref:GNAT family acetyltransferase n=1 Tax=Ruegeria marisrubri TaxID=1685379 RepID=A0A0X3TL36_9RHOB|nr:DUF2798 domain-containing protein [Ruegeria marisrubri]KUJ76448.1 hypothetical protein AVO45_11675 [Ruegeria marisrubri]
MIPARFAPILFGFILSGLMSCIVTCIATVKEVGFGPATFSSWMGAWGVSWPVAFAVVLFVAPLTRRLVALLVRPEA